MKGTRVICILNLLTIIGWGSIGLILSSEILFAITKVIPFRFSTIGLGILAFSIAFCGYDVIHKFQSYAYIPSLISIIIVLVELGKDGSFTVSVPKNLNKAEAILKFAASIMGASIGWTPMAADYNIMRPADTQQAPIFFLTYFSLILSVAASEAVGAACGTVVFKSSHYADSYKLGNIAGLLDDLLQPLGDIGKKVTFVLFLFTAMSSSILSKYSTGFAIQALGNRALLIPRWLWTIVGSAMVTGVALIGANSFNKVLTNLLGIASYWMSIYTCIVLEEHIIFRSRYGYKLDDWNTPSRLPVGIAAGVSSIVGVIGAVLGMQQPWFTGPIAKLIGSPGGDIGFELSAM
ncbi:Purine-cytosine permease fcyB [Neolecta irregularis DAH-3]|uniref:Purine-cytosine permease fcyB n=1 Tax=Neolecta irregularis (strain DAH-3) TaxID=1198029 RepID=A0A1U7LLH5_NEOID|nr:Purine-cytosine permease fcyB [Neolecta irregularis DAH-3]|eukprot:OLL23510.1 Purine-cytosine permease fcyB [Neolecta irregularis DAH-3]